MSNRKNIMLAYPFEEKRLARWEPPYLCQPKLDGERCRAIWSREIRSYILLSSEENLFYFMDHIIAELNSSGLAPKELDGELYSHGMNFNQIHSIVSREVNKHPEAESMDYHIFDYMSEETQGFRTIRLRDCLHPEISANFFKNLKLVPSYLANNIEEVMYYYYEFLDRGYEGIIVRDIYQPYLRKPGKAYRSPYMMKFKPKKWDTYTVIGWKEEIDKNGVPKGTLGALILSSGDTEFSVGSGLKAQERHDLWKIRRDLAGKEVTVSYQHTFEGGKPRFPVFVKLNN